MQDWKPWKLVQLTTFTSSKQTLQELKTKNHVTQSCNTDNFVEKNGGDVDEDYHVKEKDLLVQQKMDST
jgi:hypothetical protein